ncbi:MAG: Hsp20 family protein [Minwuia sp.]|uniref:Hsp20 family protein n=1 Tax=Minwuia sp. TaxID=2493630 RepID=UPI003A86AC0A
MRTFDLSPLFRQSVGFDRFDRLFDVAFNANNDGPAFPAYDIVKHGEDNYRITLAVAGYGESDIDVVQEGRVLTVTGKASEESDSQEGAAILHRGIARRAFTRRFHLADTVKVTGAEMVNGLLNIDLVNQIPEAEKPRQIAINGNQKALPEAA